VKRSVGSLWVLHLVGNALLLWVGYYWLGIGESDAAHLVWSALVIVAFSCAALWMHGTAFVLFTRDSQTDLATPARTALRHVPPLFVLAVAAVVAYALLAWWRDSFSHNAFLIGSYATMKLRKPVPPSGVMRAFFALIWLLRWMIVPAILFRFGASVALRGWRGFRFLSPPRQRAWFYWPEVCGLLLCAIWVPLKLVNWIPHTKQFALQMVSFLSRLGIAYLLFVAALLVLEFLTSAGRPRLNQPSTAASP
jgi:hypothetical protein